METRSKVSNLSKGLIKRRKINDEKYRNVLEDMNKKSKKDGAVVKKLKVIPEHSFDTFGSNQVPDRNHSHCLIRLHLDETTKVDDETTKIDDAPSANCFERQYHNDAGPYEKLAHDQQPMEDMNNASEGEEGCQSRILSQGGYEKSQTKNVRGRERPPKPLAVGEPKLKLICNEHGQPIAQEGKIRFSNFLGNMARQFIPISYPDFRSIPPEIILDAMEVVMDRYEIQNEVDFRVARRSLGVSWRNEKVRLRNEAERKYATIIERINNPLEDINMEQWKEFILKTKEPAYKALREANKINRSKQEPHYSESCSFAQLHAKLKEKNPDADRFDLLVIVNTSKDGRENEIVRKLKEAKSSGKSGEEAIAEVFGPEYYGRVPGMGFGVTPTSYRYIHPLIESQSKCDAELLRRAKIEPERSLRRC